MERPLTGNQKTRQKTPIITVWVVLGIFLVACVLIALTFGLLLMGRAAAEPPQSTANLEIIPAPPSYFETATQAAGPQNVEPTIPPPPAGELGIGAYVQVTGTSGDGLRLRSEPGLDSDVMMVASEAEVFKLDNGPVSTDGYVWWHLVGPFDQNRQGWAVINYLAVVQQP